jgi:preprotein translocase subunit SecD
VLFYRILGLFAVLKLGIEGALLWTVISYLGTNNGLALTLAGITGIIVSIGVSLDSNVVYYEHLKEDIQNGRSVRSSTDRSFVSAFSTIVKADVASLIGAVILWWLTVGPVRGFAFYLGLSTLLDLVTSWAYMRPVVKFATARKSLLRRPALLGLPAERKKPSTDTGTAGESSLTGASR